MEAFALVERNRAEIINAQRPVLKSKYNAILTPMAISVCTSDVNTVYGSGSKSLIILFWDMKLWQEWLRQVKM